jgi:uroporphyrinogen decarboxylase
MIADITAQYLSAKIKAGAAAVQIFDTWGGILGQQEFYEFSLRYIERIIQQLTKGDEPVIVFAKGVHHSLDKLAQCGADVLGLDWTMDIGKVRAAVGSQVALQGNLDPTVLYAEADVIADKALSVMEAYGNGSGHIFNLGHGILPDIKPEHAKALVHTVKTKSQRFH